MAWSPLHLWLGLRRSSWMPGASAPALSEKRNAFFRLWKKKGLKEEHMTQVGWYAIGTATTLASNKRPSAWRRCFP